LRRAFLFAPRAPFCGACTLFAARAPPFAARAPLSRRAPPFAAHALFVARAPFMARAPLRRATPCSPQRPRHARRTSSTPGASQRARHARRAITIPCVSNHQNRGESALLSLSPVKTPVPCEHIFTVGRGMGSSATRSLHGAFLVALAHSLRQAGIKFYGVGRKNRSCKQIFSHSCTPLWEPTRELRGSLAVSSLLCSWILLARQLRPLVARMQPEAPLAFCGRFTTTRLWLVVTLKNP
jgi:hypothetical protein